MSTKHVSAIFVKGVRGTDPILEDGKPQIVFVGRSNVGKSSLINAVLEKQLARSSSAPGKTINIDFFLVDNSYYFVDLPGYGYAKVSKEKHEHFRKLIAWYLFAAGVRHKLIVLIIDAVVGITDFDKESIALFSDHHLPFIIAANKIDKLKMGQLSKQLKQIHEDSDGATVIPTSSFSKEGRSELLTYILA